MAVLATTAAAKEVGVVWQSILEDDLRTRAEAAVQAIVADLPQPGQEILGPSLAGGAAGLAVLHAYLARTGRGAAHATLAQIWLQQALDGYANNPHTASLYGGLTGAGWVAAHLQKLLPAFDFEEDLGAIDEALLAH